MKVLVTGAAGFIGSRVRRALSAADHEVVAVDSMHPSIHGKQARPPEGITRVDVRDGTAMGELLHGVDAVCHLAGLGGGPDPVPSAADFAAHNDFGTAVLLTAMTAARIRRLVLASSAAIYGEGRYRMVHGGSFSPGLRLRADLDRGMFDHRAPRTGEVLTWEPVGEDAPARPRGFFGASKAAVENYAYSWGLATTSGVTALRLHHVYGPGARGGIHARFRDALVAGSAPRVFEDGGQVRDFVHVDDVVRATVAAVEQSLPGFVPLNIASGHPITLYQAASIMARSRGGPAPIVTGQYRLSDVRHVVGSPARAERALGFTARLIPAEGLAEFASPIEESPADAVAPGRADGHDVRRS
ncbi:NAD-dependent epimerase/dehydratase family protein [Nocardia bovistercoris]|uniref:NAD-dependent epimerase/dehydratase family protein n=1 Tax=Nocardia bovistercoris TaxID=2785916 RepID=A0A931ID20_9NOCA|nr:NAD-dependent epimerase/dehydratase family protein [Nocardia bovistercoris]MBH0777558.1 NAD-dependent epimerase/dehydratase family protein [Nocardia bovistercoris]